ncbi:MAG TPA: phasin family protein [Steroidobacteraceae bacterium]|nr:phasin family protein [Steroidobacteraceae bacterium]
MAVRKTRKSTRGRKPRRITRKTDVTLVDAVHQIWLAGMGALAQAQKDGPRAFETLIVDGAEFIDRSRTHAEKSLREAIATVQSAVAERMQGTRDQATETWDNLEKLFQGRVQRVLHQVGVPTAAEVKALTKRIDTLNSNVASLAKARQKVARRRPATKRVAPARAAA